MPAWLTIYCRAPATLRPSEIMSELDDADLSTLAEVHGVDESLAGPTRAALRLENDDEALDGTAIAYRAPGIRPILIHHWTSPPRVAEEIAEPREADDLPSAVESALDEVVEGVGLELGFSMYEDMGIVLAWEVARIIAHASRGFVRDDEKRWSFVDERGGYIHLDD